MAVVEEKPTIGPYRGSIDSIARWIRERGSRRGEEQDDRRVFAVASSNGNGDARSEWKGLRRLRCCALWKRKESKWSRRLGRAGARGAQDAASSARMPVARGLREQKADDRWRHVASKL